MRAYARRWGRKGRWRTWVVIMRGGMRSDRAAGEAAPSVAERSEQRGEEGRRPSGRRSSLGRLFAL